MGTEFEKNIQKYTFREEVGDLTSPFSLYRKRPVDYNEACSLPFWMQNLIVYDSLFQPLAVEGPSYFQDWQSLYFSKGESRLFHFDIYQRMLEVLLDYVDDYLHPADGYEGIMSSSWEDTYQCLELRTSWVYIDKDVQLKVKYNSLSTFYPFSCCLLEAEIYINP